MILMILTTLADYAKQKGISRARAYQLQSKLPTIDLPVYAIKDNGDKIPIIKDGEHLKQTFVQQKRATLEAELAGINMVINNCTGWDYNRLEHMKKTIENILK